MVSRSKHSLLDASLIRMDGGTQARANIDLGVVEDYAAELRAGTEFPPIVVFFDGSDYWLADGFHRFLASRELPMDMVSCDVRKGSQREAILHAVGANTAHGLKRSNADKRNAVKIILADEEWAKNSDRWIAERCGVTHPFVASIRNQVVTVTTSEESNGWRIGQDGKSYPVAAAEVEPETNGHAAEPDAEESPAEEWEPPCSLEELTSGNGVQVVHCEEPAPAPSQLAVSCFKADQPTGDFFLTMEALLASGRRFPTVYADPPWQYGNQVTRACTDRHYRTMSVEDICAEPVKQLAADDAQLHLWTTNSFLPRAFEVMDAWGFEYKSCFVWCKSQMGIGNYWRVSHEFLLLGVRGSAKSFNDHSLRSWFETERTKHSRKPRQVREFVERASRGPYLEMYGREAMPNSQWTVYGNGVEQGMF